MGISFTGASLFWLPTALLCAAIAVKVRRHQRESGLLQPPSMVGLCCVSLLNAVTVWFLGISRSGLDLKESCEYQHGVPFDEGWNKVHYAESQGFFPLHAKCSESVDLVPGWINPTIIALVLLSAAFLCAAVWLVVLNNTRGRKKTNA